MSMRMSAGSLGRGTAGGLGSLWPLCIPAALIAVAIEAWFICPWWVYGCTLAGVLALWYLLIARIPGQLRVRSIRREVPGSLVCTVQLVGLEFRDASNTAAPMRSRPPRIGGTALVATPTDLQLWAGRVGDPYPFRVVPWNTVATLEGEGHPITRGRIRVKLKDGDSFVLTATANRSFVPVTRRGLSRDRLVTQLRTIGNLGSLEARIGPEQI
jgi:hypothetical protein